MTSVTIEAIFGRLLSGDIAEDSRGGPNDDSDDESDGGSNLGSRGVYGLIDRQIRKLVKSESAGKVVSPPIWLYAQI
jgi:hypothetical protein